MPRRFAAAFVLAACAFTVAARAQESMFADPSVSAPVAAGEEVTLTYANRTILTLRARVVARMPADRAATTVRVLDELVAHRIIAPVDRRAVAGAVVITVAGRSTLALVPADVDPLSGDTLDGLAAVAVANLKPALADALELRTPRELLRGGIEAAAITLLLIPVVWLLVRLDRVAVRRLSAATERRTTVATWHGEALRLVHLPRVIAYGVTAILTLVGALVVYLWLSFVLRRFPYTRPWGESLRTLLAEQLSSAGSALIDALPGLLAVAVITVAARAATKVVTLMFDAVARGRMSIPGVYPDTAVATRRLVNSVVWLLALAMAYPHVPGSNSEAFKGLSLFIGVVVSLGSSGIVQHLMSGLMLTFSRAVHAGDFARIGDVTGTVLQIGALATKVRTPYGEEITIPNAVVVSQTTTNYSEDDAGGVPLLTTSVTIGYDTPWRQVEGLLLMAAEETPGVRGDPAPFVWRAALEDFYVKYTLLVAPEIPRDRAALIDRLHVRILDAFNQYGVQIMSPHYVVDPDGAKVVPRARWHAEPAAVPQTPRREPAPLGADAGNGPPSLRKAPHNIP
jgi:small-conductance mechanosensitive channel